MFGRDGVPDGAKEGADFLHGAWLDGTRGASQLTSKAWV